MSICDADLLAYGKVLLTGTSEIELRNSIGRSYYAAYHRANKWHVGLPSPGVAPGGKGVHATLVDQLVAPTVVGPKAMQSKSIGYMLRTLHAARRKADYFLDESVDRSEAESVAAMSETLLNKAV